MRCVIFHFFFFVCLPLDTLTELDSPEWATLSEQLIVHDWWLLCAAGNKHTHRLTHTHTDTHTLCFHGVVLNENFHEETKDKQSCCLSAGTEKCVFVCVWLHKVSWLPSVVRSVKCASLAEGARTLCGRWFAGWGLLSWCLPQGKHTNTQTHLASLELN